MKSKNTREGDKTRKRFSSHFKLGKSQPELDFVDVDLDGDLPLYIDPFAMKQRSDRWSYGCSVALSTYFQAVIDSIRSNNIQRAKYLLSHLGEPNEIRLGLCKSRPKGAGIGKGQADQILNALRDSMAVKTGFLTALEDCELMVDGIARDKISDLTANVIRGQLIEYTREQCTLLNVPMRTVAMPPIFAPETLEWNSKYGELPVYQNSLIILVPKVIVRHHPSLDHQGYYNNFVLDFLQGEALQASSSLVKTLKDGTQRVFKKELKQHFPCSKEFLYRFSKENPKILERYKEQMAAIAKTVDTDEVDEAVNEKILAETLRTALREVPRGGECAAQYHSLILGIVEFIFFPSLSHPVKEKEIHEGRKRIDIVMDNGAKSGIFHKLHDIFKLPCPFVHIECKNYTRDPNNPELDQLAGRMSPQRGKVGVLFCRGLEDQELFDQRCKDTYKDDRGLILALDDPRLDELLELVQRGKRHLVDERLEEWFREIAFS